MKSKKFLIFGAILVVAVGFVGVTIMNKPDTESNIGGYKEGTRVTVDYVKEEDIETKISSSGKLECVNTKTLYLDASNKIMVLHKENGDYVEKGEVIMTLDKEAQVKIQNELVALEKQLDAEKQALSQLKGKGSQADILNAQTTLAELKDTKKTAQKNIEDAKVEVANLYKDLKEIEEDIKTNKELFDVGAISQKEIDDLEDKLEDTKEVIRKKESDISLNEQSLSTMDDKIKTAQYNLDLLQNKVTDENKKQLIAAKESSIQTIINNIENSQTSLGKATTQVVAPISGIITYLPAEEGMMLAAGEKIVTIIDPSELKVNCQISPYYAAELRLGLDATVKYTGSKTIEVPGKVSKIAAVAEVEKGTNGETVNLPVEVSVQDPGEIIRPGFSVDVKIITDKRENASVVPILAIKEEEDLSYIYVVKEDGTLEKREVVQGLSNGLSIEVSNVKPGEMIVSTVEDYLEDGMKVSYEKIAVAEENVEEGVQENTEGDAE